MLNIGVIGAGHLGKIHLKLLEQSDKYNLIGFFDDNAQTRENISKEFGYKAFETIDDLINSVEVIDIVTPTPHHFETAKKSLENNKHVFIEKPITSTVEQANELIKLSKKHDKKIQVGHVERFNPAFIASEKFIKNPMFIESHRLAEFNPRGTDVPVVLDLMIHDLDIILKVVNSKVTKISSSGISVISQTPDIANARVEFENGCVANITTSRISMKNMRKTRFFQKDAYISVDFLEKKSEIISISDAPESPDEFAMIVETAEKTKKQIFFEKPEVKSNNAILDELDSFADSIENGSPIKVTAEQATNALEIAIKIINEFNKK